MAVPSLEGRGAPQLEETEHLNMEFANEDLLHQFDKDPLESTPLNVEFPSSPVAPTIVMASPSIARGEILKDVIPIEVTPLRKKL